MKKIVSLILIFTFLTLAFTSCNPLNLIDNVINPNGNEREFHAVVSESQELLDILADDIYKYWFDSIYNDKYMSNINYAIAAAMSDNSANIDIIEVNHQTIKSLYVEVRDGDLGDEVKAVMQAYNDYYSFVMEVSGSFNSYSASKETLKKELSSALKNLEFEL